MRSLILKASNFEGSVFQVKTALVSSKQRFVREDKSAATSAARSRKSPPHTSSAAFNVRVQSPSLHCMSGSVPSIG